MREVLELKRMALADATGDWLRHSGVIGRREVLDK
jgi:hypothetical protein